MLDTYLYTASDGRCIAYSTENRAEGSKNLPGIVFLGGLRSDMTGTKAIFLHQWAAGSGRSFLRFDYTGHGASSGRFEDGCVGEWVRDAAEVIGAVTEGPQILVGSSLGGWVALLLARDRAVDTAGLVGIAAAPDFTEDGMWAEFSLEEREALKRDGRIFVPSDYSDEPYVITRKLIEDGRRQLVLRSPLMLDCPVRLLHGTNDTDVPLEVPLRLLAHAQCSDMRLTLVKGADHRLSSADGLNLITTSIEDVSQRAGK